MRFWTEYPSGLIRKKREIVKAAIVNDFADTTKLFVKDALEVLNNRENRIKIVSTDVRCRILVKAAGKRQIRNVPESDID